MANWTRDQQLAALRLYLTTPFGKLHKTNPKIVALAASLGRTPSALSMKACNFASLDPTFRDSGRAGLSGASKADGELWLEFVASRGELIDSMEALVEPVLDRLEPRVRTPPSGDDEVVRPVKVRRHQRFFREETLSAYGSKCALSGLDLPELLVASHIIPWSENKARRIDPTNGILLNSLLDRAFDSGLISFDSSYRVLCSARLKKKATPSRKHILEFEGATLRMPERTPPDLAAIGWHRERWDFAA